MPITQSITPILRSKTTTCAQNFQQMLQRQHDLLYGGMPQATRPRGTVLTLMDDKSKIVLNGDVPQNKVMGFARIVEEWQENYLAHFADRFNICEKDEKIHQAIERELEDELLESVQKEIPKEIEFDDLRELTQLVANAAKSFYENSVIAPVKNMKLFQRLSKVMEEFWQNEIKMADMSKETDELFEVAKAKQTRGAYKNYNVHARQYNKMVDRQDEIISERTELQEGIYNQMQEMGFRPLAFYRTVRTNAFEPQLGELKPLKDGIIEDQKRMAELEGKTDALSKSQYKTLKKAIKAKQDKIKEVDRLNRKTIEEYGVSEDLVSRLYLEKPETPAEKLPKRKKPIFVMNGKEL